MPDAERTVWVGRWRRNSRMVITIFRSRLRPENQEAYQRTAARMDQLAHQMPGFVAIKTFSAPDGERVSIVEFESEATHNAWRRHPEHIEAQRLGRELFYSEFRIQVCKLERDYGMPPGQAP
jgi:heme-degrading monooxygenase HmoA